MNSEEFFEELAKKYPRLMAKSEIGEHIGVGEGWYGIISTLCWMIYHPVSSQERRLTYFNNKESLTEDESLQREDTIKKIEELAEGLPVIVQIKEKFGGLRFYVDNSSHDVNCYIEFAEAMSGKTCEECGAPGEPRNTGWVKTLCERHHKEREQKTEPTRLQRAAKWTGYSEDADNS